MAGQVKLTIDQQIEWMKEKGVTFQYYEEEDAAEFLRNNTYFFKLKAFQKDYIQNPKTGKYIGLDFAYLVELSTLDMHLRRLILHATLDIEHFLKVRLLSRLSDDATEDGYDIIQRYFRVDGGAKEKIREKAQNSMCADLVAKMERDGYALWNVVEVLSFGDFFRLYEIYDANHGGLDEDIRRCLFSIRLLRNAAAHNNCLLNSLRSPYTRKINPTYALTRFISQIPGLPNKSREKKMANPLIHDFLALLYVYQRVVTSKKTVQHFSRELYDLFHGRMPKHKEYFQSNESLLSAYQFVVRIVDALYPCDAPDESRH